MNFIFNIPENTYFKTSFAVIKLGNDAMNFLSGLVANDLDSNETAFTDINGKIIAHAWIMVRGDEVFLLANRPYDEELIQHLKKYLRISSTTMEAIDTDVYHLFTPKKEFNNSVELNAGILVWGVEPSILKDMQSLTLEHYEKIRLYYDMPVQGIDFENNMLLELNRSRLISYDKGCYLGQEIIARVTSRGKTPRLLVRTVSKVEPESDENIRVMSAAFFEDPECWLSYVFIKNSTDLKSGMEIISD